MKSLLLVVCLIFCTCTSIISQNYNGKLGYSVSPLGHPDDFSQFGPFLQEVASTCNGGVVMANGKWYDTTAGIGNVPVLQRTVSSLQPTPYNFTDLLVYGWATWPVLYLDNPGDTTNNWTNATTRSLYLQMLIQCADSFAPEYLFIGNEVSFYIAQDSLDYQNWASFYSSAYDSIKAHSPNTKVGTVFNYEHLSGEGVNVNWTAPHWNALLDMDTSKMDVVGLTLYPFLSYDNTASIPGTYLDPLFAQIGNIPLVITETGWPGDSLVPGWSASPQEQVNYVNDLFTMINGRDVPVVNWLFLNYMMDTSTLAEVLFVKSIALRDSLGNDRPALAVWLSQCSSMDVEDETALNETVRVYPNPTRDACAVETKSSGEFVLYDVMGRDVLHQQIAQGKTQVDLGSLAPGVYHFMVTGAESEVVSGKLVIE
jgi:hypothetical protein